MQNVMQKRVLIFELQNSLENEMTTADISTAQAMARECMNSGYTKCGY